MFNYFGDLHQALNFIKKFILSGFLVFCILFPPDLVLKNAFATVVANKSATLEKIENLYIASQLNPFNSEVSKDFLDIVFENQDLLKQKNKGQILQQYLKVRNLQLMREELSKCLGTDPLSADLKSKLLSAALQTPSEQLRLQDCFSRTSSLLSLTQAMQEASKSISDQQRNEKLKALNQKLFDSTLSAAADKYSEIVYLIPENLKQSDSPERAFCENANCPQDLINRLQKRNQDMRAKLQAKGIKSATAKSEAAKIQVQMNRAYASIYSRTDFTRSDIGPAAGKFSRELKTEFAPPSPQYEEWKKQAELTESEEFTKIRDELIQNNPVVRILRTSGYKDLDQILYLGDPTIIRDEYDQISANPWEQSYKNKLVIKRTTPVTDIGTEVKSINEKMIIEARDHSLKSLANGMKDLIKEHSSAKGSIDEQKEQIKKLIAINSFGAGQVLLQDPSLASIYCDAIQSLAKDEKDNQWWEQAATIATLLSLPAGGLGLAAMSGVRGAVFAASAARGLVIGASIGEVGGLGYSSVQDYQNYQNAQLLQSTCWIQESSEVACKEAKEQEDSAIESLMINGVALTTLGGVAKAAKIGLSRGLLTNSEKIINTLGRNTINEMGDDLFSVYAARMQLAEQNGNSTELAKIKAELESIRKMDSAQVQKLRREYETRKAGQICEI